ncbi:hypothetical protein HK405_015406 [Cladochytrium tenue]|nr:hypothetical protein HK405_015406 [Cladochytrium tenue]
MHVERVGGGSGSGGPRGLPGLAEKPGPVGAPDDPDGKFAGWLRARFAEKELQLDRFEAAGGRGGFVGGEAVGAKGEQRIIKVRPPVSDVAALVATVTVAGCVWWSSGYLIYRLGRAVLERSRHF